MAQTRGIAPLASMAPVAHAATDRYLPSMSTETGLVASSTSRAASFDARQRTATLNAIEDATFDLVIVGAGINGAGVAHDAALRGLKVLLLEQRDLAFGTSSRSSKLVHGGLRYLETYQFKLVFEGTNERAALRKIAPHLVRPLMFALPVYKGDRYPLWMMDIGLWMYDTLSMFKAERFHTTLRSAARMLDREPLLNPEGLTGGVVYYDCMTDDARITLENAMAAAELGAPTVTRARVDGVDDVHAQDRPCTVRFTDLLSGATHTVKAHGVVNCTGAWTDAVRRMAEVERDVIRPTKGVHLVVKSDRLDVQHANAVLAPQDGRLFFAIPWQGRTVLGTTDTDFQGDLSEVGVTAEDVSYLLEAANFRFPSARLTADDVIATWAGLRPLVKPDADVSESEVPREHKIYTDGRMTSIAGGKLTTYRRMAAETVDAAAKAAGLRAAASKTLRHLLPGARGLNPDLAAAAAELGQQSGLPDDVCQRLVEVYGVCAGRVASYVAAEPSYADRITPDRPAVFAEVAHAVDHELAVTVDDVLVRRTSVALTAEDQGSAAVERVADIMGTRLGWSAADRQRHMDEYAHTLSLSRAFRL